MTDMNFDQQREVFDPNFAKPVTVIGVGSVGSQAVATLAKEGCDDITVWDGDYVASHNIPMSEYRPTDLMRLKVEALQEIVLTATGIKIKTMPCMYDGAP